MNDFRVYQQTLIHRWIKILLFLGIFLIPLYSILDYFTVPEGLFLPFLIARLTASALLIVITLVVHFSPVSAIDHLYGYLFTIIVGGVISWMTVNLGGFDSGYYAGLNLVVIAVNLVVPWKYVHTIANALLVLLMYGALNLLTPQPFQWTILINNLYFLTSTALIVSVISWLRYDLVKKEYDSRQKADASQTEEIAELARAAERLSSGDFTVNLDLEFSSTAGTLLSAFQKMREDLKNALRQISLASHNVEGYARQIMDHTHLMAEGTEKQSAQAEESVETIKALANQIRRTLRQHRIGSCDQSAESRIIEPSYRRYHQGHHRDRRSDEYACPERLDRGGPSRRAGSRIRRRRRRGRKACRSHHKCDPRNELHHTGHPERYSGGDRRNGNRII